MVPWVLRGEGSSNREWLRLWDHRYRDFAGMKLSQLDDLVQAPANVCEGTIRQSSERMRFRTPHTPVKRFWLMAKDVAGFPILTFTLGLADRNRKGVVSIILSCGHGKTDDEGGDTIEVPRRKNQERMYITHFVSGLWIAVDPNNVLAIRHPRPTVFRFFLCCHHTSAPTAWARMASPP